MNYSNEIVINLSRERVLELFDNPDNMKHWQESFVSFEHLSGKPGEVGAKSKLKYLMGKRKVEMIETITKRNLPDEFAGTYEAKNVHNLVDNTFLVISENETKWVSYNEFSFSGFMKIIAFFMPGAFKKQSMKYLVAFKKFAENSSQNLSET